MISDDQTQLQLQMATLEATEAPEAEGVDEAWNAFRQGLVCMIFVEENPGKPLRWFKS